MDVDKEFRFVRFSDGLSDKRSEKLVIAVVGGDLDLVC